MERILVAIREDADSRARTATRIVLLGNILDRGPHSAMVVDLCMRMAKRTDLFTVLKGPHEAIMVAALRGDLEAFQRWIRHGGDATLASWNVNMSDFASKDAVKQLVAARSAVPPEVVFWLEALPKKWRSGRYLLRHDSDWATAAALPGDDALAAVYGDPVLEHRLLRPTVVRAGAVIETDPCEETPGRIEARGATSAVVLDGKRAHRIDPRDPFPERNTR